MPTPQKNLNSSLKQYNELKSNEQEELFAYIKDLPLNMPDVEVNHKHFYLVHSYPKDNLMLRMKDCDYNDDYIIGYVWDRVEDPKTINVVNHQVIAGHTPVLYHLGTRVKPKPFFDGDEISKAHYIDIDGGLAANLPTSRLLALCLDDLSYSLF